MIRKLLRNFWFCLCMAVFSLFALYGAALEGDTFWIWIDAGCVLVWAHSAYRINKPVPVEHELTDDQSKRLSVITKRFVKETAEILNERRDESDNGKDKETDKKQSDDE